MRTRSSGSRRRLLSGAAADQLFTAGGSGLFLLLVAESGRVSLTGSVALITAMVLMATNPVRALMEDWIYADAGYGGRPAGPGRDLGATTDRSPTRRAIGVETETRDPVATVVVGSLWLGVAGTPMLAVLILASLGRAFEPAALLLSVAALPASTGSAGLRTGLIAARRAGTAAASSLARLAAVAALGPFLSSGPSTTAVAGAWAAVSAVPIIVGLAIGAVRGTDLIRFDALRTTWARRGGLLDPTLIAASGALGLVLVGRFGSLPDIASIRAAASLLAPMTTVLTVIRISNLDAFRTGRRSSTRRLVEWVSNGLMPTVAALSIVAVLQLRTLWPLELLSLAADALPMLALVPALQIVARRPIDRASYDGRYRRLSSARIAGEGVFLAGLFVIDVSAGGYFGLRALSLIVLMVVLAVGRNGRPGPTDR